MGKLFGTDGIRGVAGAELDCALAMKTGAAAVKTVREVSGKDKPTFLVGKDSRLSSDMLEAAICAGVCESGANVIRLGLVPTPAVAYLTVQLGADAGIMISASHNPYEYNGIKIFGGEGYKLTDEQEEEIEKIIEEGNFEKKSGEGVGWVRFDEKAIEKYEKHIMSAAETLAGMKIALDASNGSASRSAKAIFEGLGAECKIIGNAPNGMNINDGVGSTHIENLKSVMKSGKYDVGFAFDGDADRCIAVDEKGEEVDGDAEMAIVALKLRDEGRLAEGALVATVMSNMGLRKFAKENGILLEETGVGDRYVLERMREKGYSLGGEQSGHIIVLDYMTTGDGQLSAVLIADRLKKTGMKMSQAAAVMKKYPQRLKNITANAEEKARFKTDAEIEKIVEKYTAEIGDGRILVRASGTEPLIRIMAEGAEIEKVDAIVDACAAEIEVRIKR